MSDLGRAWANAAVLTPQAPMIAKVINENLVIGLS